MMESLYRVAEADRDESADPMALPLSVPPVDAPERARRGLLDQIQKALVIAPHPDDEVLGAGGTIARLARQGCDVQVCILTRGHASRFPEAMTNHVREESAMAHRTLGVSRTHFCDLPAAELDQVPHAELNERMGEIIGEMQPDALFLPFVGDIHLDHQLAFLSAMVAARPRHDHAPSLILAYETLSETNWLAPGVTPAFIPNFFVDISDTLETKLAAFAAYASQVRAFPDERSLEALRALAIVRGATVFRRAAEAFMLVRQIA